MPRPERWSVDYHVGGARWADVFVSDLYEPAAGVVATGRVSVTNAGAVRVRLLVWADGAAIPANSAVGQAVRRAASKVIVRRRDGAYALDW